MVDSTHLSMFMYFDIFQYESVNTNDRSLVFVYSRT